MLGGGLLTVPIATLAGALLTGALLVALTWRAGIDGYRLVLIGIAVWAAAAAVVDWLLTRAEIHDAAAAYVWITGSVLIAVGCVAGAVAAAGPVGFVALVVPQIAVRLTAGSRPPLLASGLLGAVLVVGADLAARSLLPQALPVGILTAGIGAPYLLWLLVRGRRRSTL